MSILEYGYNILAIICCIDLTYCTYLIKKDKFIVKQFGLDKIFKIKLLIEKLVIVSYIIYIIHTIVMCMIH